MLCAQGIDPFVTTKSKTHPEGLSVVPYGNIFNAAGMLAGKCSTAGAVTETGVGIVTAIAALVTGRTKTYIYIRMSEYLLRKFEIDTLVGYPIRCHWSSSSAACESVRAHSAHQNRGE